ncbi:NAD(P)/FAD-dependent oxidoreductase [Pedobacter punctiformis]|uniref:FAD-binding oxidoreductase n=1 Tax=Pedobacter punctiformis TaxID=3004097 RepID=A0ABT4L5L7_9SPHI|nr:FAD-binding oxidoreductase [Pedobacter sp. HCMS5-2]MCZ4243200.1 FAD-binding oxidoreductase [Pedobacter sp. HCMS5-2]
MVTAQSYWEKTSFFLFDFIIIGSGIVGLNAAIHLKKFKPNSKICILERGFLPSGASTKNAGFACFGSISELIDQESICGTEGLSFLIEKRWKGLLKLRNLLSDEKIDYQCLGGYELFKKTEQNLTTLSVSKIEHFNNLIKNIVGENAFSLQNQKIKEFGFKNIENLIANRYEAQIDTGKMMFALLQYAQSLGIAVFNNCTVNKIEGENKGISLLTDEGIFKCHKVVVTTNAFTQSLLPDLDITPGRGQILITKPIKNLKIKGTFHYDRGYYYFRNINDRILLGGGRNLDFNAEATTTFGQTDLVQNALENLLSKVILPDTDYEIDQRWSGIMAFGKQLEPIIKEVKPNVFCAARCNGMGIAMGSQTGEDVAQLLINSL